MRRAIIITVLTAADVAIYQSVALTARTCTSSIVQFVHVTHQQGAR